MVPVPCLVPANRRTSPALSADTPAVAYDGDLDVSRRTPAPGLVRRADAAPCVHLATALTTLMSSKEPQFPADSGGSTHDAKLHFANKSHRLCAFSHSAHCRALTQLAEHARRLHILSSAQLYNSCRTLQIVLSKRSLTLICRLSRNFLRKPAKQVLLTCLTITLSIPQSCADLSSGRSTYARSNCLHVASENQ